MQFKNLCYFFASFLVFFQASAYAGKSKKISDDFGIIDGEKLYHYIEGLTKGKNGITCSIKITKKGIEERTKPEGQLPDIMDSLVARQELENIGDCTESYRIDIAKKTYPSSYYDTVRVHYFKERIIPNPDYKSGGVSRLTASFEEKIPVKRGRIKYPREHRRRK